MEKYSENLHFYYEKSISTFAGNYKKLNEDDYRNIDTFFRMCALVLWKNFGVSASQCTKSLSAIYTKKLLEFSEKETAELLECAGRDKIEIKIPEFFIKIVRTDMLDNTYYSRVFIDGLQYILLLFTLIDENITWNEVKAATEIVTKLSDYCDGKNIRTYNENADLSVFVTKTYNEKQHTDNENNISCQRYENNKSSIDKLDALIGLKRVKTEVSTIANFANVQKMRKNMGLPATNVSYHLVFTGNPGTGKTTVARIVGEIYKEIGILSKGHIVEVDRGDLVAGYVGQTAIKTKEMIDKAMGGVLFIDEAYALADKGDNDFGQEAIDTILKAMEDNRDDFVVIVAGYDELMEQFINSNPGLQSRFTHYIHFDDYTGEELTNIFKKLCIDNRYELERDTEEPLKKYFYRLAEKHTANFGNAREVRNFFENVISKQANRISGEWNLSKEDIVKIKLCDLELNEADESDDLKRALDELNDLTGLTDVKAEINGLVKLVEYQKLRKQQGLRIPNMSLHLAFTGNPGTGKTTVARCVAQIYKCLGLVSEGQLVETDRSDFVAGYVGQTAIKTRKTIEKAMGGVLFIDEAYTLTEREDDFGQEAIDTLLKFMEDCRDNLVVIVAGYTDEMENFIKSNPGLESRFNRYIEFKDYTSDELVDIFKNICKKNQYNITDDALKFLKNYFSSISASAIGNGRGVRNIFEKVITYQANNLDVSKIMDISELSTITENDVAAVINA